MRCIDADRLLTDRMKSKYYHLPNGDIAIPLIDIEHAPTIEPEQKTGKWIRWTVATEDEAGIEYTPHCKCSECGTEYDPHSSKFVKFCHVCGAKMEGNE